MVNPRIPETTYAILFVVLSTIWELQLARNVLNRIFCDNQGSNILKFGKNMTDAKRRKFFLKTVEGDFKHNRMK